VALPCFKKAQRQLVNASQSSTFVFPRLILNPLPDIWLCLRYPLTNNVLSWHSLLVNALPSTRYGDTFWPQWRLGTL